jgi:hypothetical protein
MDGHHGVAAVVLAAEHLLDLAGLDLGLELVEPAREIVIHRLAGLDPLGQHLEILGPPRQRRAERDVVLETAPALLDLLGFSLVLPEIGFGYASFELRELIGGTCNVKDSSAAPRRA